MALTEEECRRQTVAKDLVHFLRDYAQTRINSRLFDARRCIPPYVVLDFGRAGLLGMRASQKYGGLDLGYVASIPVIEQLAAIDLSLSMLAGIHNGLGIGTLVACGSQQAQEEFLPLLASGRMLGGFALTEDSAGSNPRAIQGSAERLTNGQWKLNAEKIWVGNGAWAGMLNVFVRAKGMAPHGFGGFVVRTSLPGVTIGPEAMTMGMRSIVQNRIQFTDVEIAPHYQLNLAEPAERLFHLARFGLAIVSSGAMKRCAQMMLRYAKRRTISTGRLASNPVFIAGLQETIYSFTLLDRLCSWIAHRLDQNEEVPAAAFYVCKAVGPEYLGRAADRLIQFMGGRGYMDANEAPQIFRDARLLRIFEGPTETMYGHLGSMWRSSPSTLAALFMDTKSGFEARTATVNACREIWEAPAPAGRDIGQQSFARYSAMGEVIAYGTICGFIGDGEEGLRAWGWQAFDAAHCRALALVGCPSSPSGYAEIEARLTDAIGDLTQALSGEEWGLDPLLMK